MDAFAEPERSVGDHIRMAHETLGGEHQLAQYVAGLGIEECARILAQSTTGLSILAALRDECRVGTEEKRSFEEVIRIWTLEVLSGIEG
jgi:hypothetical protein